MLMKTKAPGTVLWSPRHQISKAIVLAGWQLLTFWNLFDRRPLCVLFVSRFPFATFNWHALRPTSLPSSFFLFCHSPDTKCLQTFAVTFCVAVFFCAIFSTSDDASKSLFLCFRVSSPHSAKAYDCEMQRDECDRRENRGEKAKDINLQLYWSINNKKQRKNSFLMCFYVRKH